MDANFNLEKNSKSLSKFDIITKEQYIKQLSSWKK